MTDKAMLQDNRDKSSVSFDHLTFTFMHLADAFIQSGLDLKAIQTIIIFFVRMCFPWELNS